MYFNALTKQEYSANNQNLLAEAGYDEDEIEVAGFHQWLELGRCVAKGEHGTKILMVCEAKDKKDPNKKRKVCKTRTVFFRSQTVELPAA